MAALRPLKLRQVLSVLNKLGFKKVSQKGSHAKFSHTDGRITTVPMHSGELIGRGLLRKIIKDSKLSKDEFLEML